MEDLWGAGAFVAALAGSGVGPLSPESEAALAAFQQASADIHGRLHACASGRELAAAGYPEDVDVAAEVDASHVVPLLMGESFGVAT